MKIAVYMIVYTAYTVSMFFGLFENYAKNAVPSSALYDQAGFNFPKK